MNIANQEILRKAFILDQKHNIAVSNSTYRDNKAYHISYQDNFSGNNNYNNNYNNSNNNSNVAINLPNTFSINLI